MSSNHVVLPNKRDLYWLIIGNTDERVTIVKRLVSTLNFPILRYENIS